MASYPDLMTAYGSDPVPIEQLEVDRAEDGTARVRSKGTDKARFTLVHPRLNSTDKSTLDSFYSTNRLLEITYACKTDSASYTCVFAGPPKYERHPGSYWTATVMLEQV
jgi:hypothetical protein